MKVFITGASGYIGGSVADALMKRGDAVSGLARSDATAAALRKIGIAPVAGTLDDAAALGKAARDADVTVNTANADHRGAAEAMVKALTGTGKTLIHTSGSSIVGTPARGELVEAVFDEDTPFTPMPARAARVAIDTMIARRDRHARRRHRADADLRPRPRPQPAQHPGAVADRAGEEGRRRPSISAPARTAGPTCTSTTWCRFILLAIDKAPAGAFYFAENGENSMREMCEAIGRMLGQGGRTQSMTIEEAAAEWGAGAADNTMGSNSRVRAKRARAELGWKPKAPSLIEEIERGCYAE